VAARTFLLACVASTLCVSGLYALQHPAAVHAAQAGNFGEAVKAASELPRLYGLVVSRRGEIVLEKYFNGTRSARAANVKSVSKSIVSALVGVAIERGLVPGPDTPIRTYFPELSKDRDDLAKAALVERQKAAEMAESLHAEVAQIEQVLRGYEADIQRLQVKLAEARARQNAIATRFESALTRARTSEVLHGSRTEEAFAKFELLERRADFAEGRADALGLTGPKSLEEEIAELRAADTVDAELDQMKAALAAAK